MLVDVNVSYAMRMVRRGRRTPETVSVEDVISIDIEELPAGAPVMSFKPRHGEHTKVVSFPRFNATPVPRVTRETLAPADRSAFTNWESPLSWMIPGFPGKTRDSIEKGVPGDTKAMMRAYGSREEAIADCRTLILDGRELVLSWAQKARDTVIVADDLVWRRNEPAWFLGLQLPKSDLILRFGDGDHLFPPLVTFRADEIGPLKEAIVRLEERHGRTGDLQRLADNMVTNQLRSCEIEVHDGALLRHDPDRFDARRALDDILHKATRMEGFAGLPSRILSSWMEIARLAEQPSPSFRDVTDALRSFRTLLDTHPFGAPGSEGVGKIRKSLGPTIGHYDVMESLLRPFNESRADQGYLAAL